jgi:hypothetical protein
MSAKTSSWWVGLSREAFRADLASRKLAPDPRDRSMRLEPLTASDAEYGTLLPKAKHR